LKAAQYKNPHMPRAPFDATTRRQHSSLRFGEKHMKQRCLVATMAMLVAVSATVSAAPVTQAIKMDNFGYRPTDVKVAIFIQDPGGVVQIKDVNDVVVFTIPGDGGSITSMGFDNQPSGHNVWQVDFTPFTTAGTYRLYVPAWNQQSYDFKLDVNVYNEVGKAALKTFYYQRCGVAHSQPYAKAAWSDPQICHGYLSATTPGANQTNYGVLDLTGGWHDAGDYNKYVWGDLELAMVMLMTAYEINPAAFPDGSLVLPGGSNGVPDIIDEVKFEIDWLLKMQMSDGKVLSRVWDEYAGAPDPSPPSKAVHNHHYYSPNVESSAIFAGSVAMFARICASLGDPYGNVAALRQAALLTWNNYLLGQSEAQNAWGGGWKVWAAAELWRMDQSITSARTYVENRYADWSTAFMEGYSPNSHAAYAYIQTPGANATVVSRMKIALGNTVNSTFANRGLYRNSMADGYYHWGSNKVFGSWGVLLLQAARLGATGSQTAAQCRELAGDLLHHFHGQNAMGMNYLTNMAALGGEHSSFQFYHSWFGAITDPDSVSLYRGKPQGVTEPDYPYFKGVDNYGVSDNNASQHGPVPGLVVGGPNKDYGGQATPPRSSTYYERFYRDWIDNSPDGWYRTKVWEVNENSISYQAPYVALIAGFMTAGTPSSDGTPPANPAGLVATAVKSTQIDLDWSNNTEGDLFGYDVYRSSTFGGPYTLIHGGATTSAYSDRSVSQLNTYYYVVRAIDRTGNESGNSGQASATTPSSAGTMHVSSMPNGAQKGKDSGWWSDVFVVSNTGTAVAGATVTVTATGRDTSTGQNITETKSGVTDSSGKVRLVTTVNTGSMCVTSVTHATSTYDPDQNVITCIGF
jgi:endoglucanase